MVITFVQYALARRERHSTPCATHDMTRPRLRYLMIGVPVFRAQGYSPVTWSESDAPRLRGSMQCVPGVEGVAKVATSLHGVDSQDCPASPFFKIKWIWHWVNAIVSRTAWLHGGGTKVTARSFAEFAVTGVVSGAGVPAGGWCLPCSFDECEAERSVDPFLEATFRGGSLVLSGCLVGLRGESSDSG